MVRKTSLGAVLAALAICGAPAALNAQPGQSSSDAAAPPTLPGSQQPRVQTEHYAKIIQQEPASSAAAPHIDWVTLREERRNGRVFIVQKIGYHAQKGNANNLHFQLVGVSPPDVKFDLSDHAIHAPGPRQQRGTFILVRFGCGPSDKTYSHVKRAIITDADGERSNAVEFTVDCNLALAS